MSVNEKMLKELAMQLGLSKESVNSFSNLKKYENASDNELKREISKVREELRAKNISYDKQIEMVKGLMPMMDGKQKARLMEIIKLLE